MLTRSTCLFALLLTAISAAEAATFVAQNFYDLPDIAPGDGVCSWKPGVLTNNFTHCTLRAAVMEANATMLKDTIRLLPGITYKLTLPGRSLGAEAGDLNITRPLRIEAPSNSPGSASRAVIDAQKLDRVFEISSSEVELYNLGITGGETDQFGSAILMSNVDLTLTASSVYGNHGDENKGKLGAIRGSASLSEITLVDSAIYGNDDSGVSSSGKISMIRSAVYENNGIGVFSGGEPLLIANSTISVNGVGIYGGTDGESSVVILNSTIVGNLGGGIIAPATSGMPTIAIINSIMSGNGGNCYFNPSIVGIALNSLYDDATCPGDPKDNNHPNTPARLSPLGDYGGPTPTHRPHSDSQAIDHADGGYCTLTDGVDQRGQPRADLDRCDIGAVEVESDVIFWDDFEEML